MTANAEQTRLAPGDFLVWEERQPDKHEYVRGEVFAMVGARREHVVATLNLASALKQRLRGSPCQAYASDLKLRVEAADAFFYPDVMVSCDARDQAAEHYLEHPSLIIEVLSDSTAAFDRGDKFAAYRTLASLREYVLVDIGARRVESFRRTADNEWLLHAYDDLAGECRLSSLDIALPMSEVFEDLQPAQVP